MRNARLREASLVHLCCQNKLTTGSEMVNSLEIVLKITKECMGSDLYTVWKIIRLKLILLQFERDKVLEFKS